MTIQTQWICRGPWCHCADSVTECACIAVGVVTRVSSHCVYCWHCRATLTLIDFATGEEVAGEALAGVAP